MTYDDALKYIHTINWRGSKRGLSRTQALLEKVGSPEKKLKFVHVAGTNGKGSTCACIESVLRTAGYNTGLYTSPFIKCFNERIRVNGENISNNELADLVAVSYTHLSEIRYVVCVGALGYSVVLSIRSFLFRHCPECRIRLIKSARKYSD